MPLAVSGSVTDFDRHFRRGVWITVLMAVIGGALVYRDKANDERSAFIRWRPQVLRFWAGENIYDKMHFPNPPIMPITLYPLMTLPPLTGALTWYALKAGLAAVSLWLCFRMVRCEDRVLPSWVQGLAIALSFRPILGDLHHGNNNLLILFLVVATLYAWRKGYDVLAGLLLALAISYKVTPALFLPYFAYKRSWRTFGATFLGLGVFLLIIPSLVIGPSFNGICLGTWWNRMMSPFLVKGTGSPQEVNQSMVGVVTRLLTDAKVGTDRYDVHLDVNVLSLSPRLVGWIIKGLSLGLVGVLAYFCRTRTDRRDDPRLFGEFALIVLAMLFLSERSWKHHYVTLIFPYTYLVYRLGMPSTPLLPRISARVRVALGAALVLSAFLISLTSTEFGSLFADKGHKYAQGYGMFFWAGVVLFVATAWRVRLEGRGEFPGSGTGPAVPAPHLGGVAAPRPSVLS